MAANSSDEIFNFKCSSCANLNRNSEAVKYCVECQGYCCQACVTTHSAFSTLRNHTFLDKSNFKSTGFTTELTPIPTERCDRHKLKLLDLYCRNHDLVGCTTCMALEHRICTDVQSIPDVIDTIFKNSDVDETYQMLQDRIQSLQKLKETRDANILELKESKGKTLKAITEFRKVIMAIVESIEKQSIKEADNEYRKIELLLTEEKSIVEDELKNLERATYMLKNAKENKALQFVLMKTAQTRITQIDTTFASFDKKTEATIEFSANPAILEFLGQLQTFGAFTGYFTSSLSPRTNAYSIKGCRELNIRSQNDSHTCCIRSVCLTHDGLLLLADGQNNKLKRVDIMRKSIADECYLLTNPNDVCCVSKFEAAVSFGNYTIQIVSLGKQMILTRTIQIDHCCLCIAYKDGRLYISSDNYHLYVHDISGSLLQTIPANKYGNKLFRCIRQVAFSDSGDNIFVADRQKGLISLDTEGNHIATFEREPDLFDVQDVCTDRRGNVFVLGFGSQTVVQIAQDGRRKVGVIIRQSDGMYRPYHICFDPVKNILIVVTLNSSDSVQLFDLQ